MKRQVKSFVFKYKWTRIKVEGRPGCGNAHSALVRSVDDGFGDPKGEEGLEWMEL